MLQKSAFACIANIYFFAFGNTSHSACCNGFYFMDSLKLRYEHAPKTTFAAVKIFADATWPSILRQRLKFRR